MGKHCLDIFKWQYSRLWFSKQHHCKAVTKRHSYFLGQQRPLSLWFHAGGWVFFFPGMREADQQDAVDSLVASSKDRIKMDCPEKGQHMSPRPQKCYQPPHIISSWQDQLNPSQPCQVPHSSHLLLWAMTSAQTKSSLVLWLCWTWGELSPGCAVPFALSKVFAVGPVAGRDFASSHAGLDIRTIHPSTRHKLDLPKAHMSETGRDTASNSPWKLLWYTS